MAKEQFYNNPEEEEDRIDFQEIIFKYLSYWKWIVGSVVICMIGAFFYLRYTAPVYNISSTILLKDDKKGGGVDELSTLQDWGVLSSKNNVDNEIEVLKSKNLLKSVVNELKLYTSYSLEGNIRNTQLYKDSPLYVDLNYNSLDSLIAPVLLEVQMSSDGKAKVTGKYDDVEFGETITEFPAIMESPAGMITLALNPVAEPVYDW